MPNVGDVIEITNDIPKRHLKAGMKGTIVHVHSLDNYEIEFIMNNGETIDFCALNVNAFLVIWQAEIARPVPLADQIATISRSLSEQNAREVLDFARFLIVRNQVMTNSF